MRETSHKLELNHFFSNTSPVNPMVKSLDHINIYPLVSPVHFILSGLLENINAEAASMGSRFDVFNKLF